MVILAHESKGGWLEQESRIINPKVESGTGNARRTSGNREGKHGLDFTQGTKTQAADEHETGERNRGTDLDWIKSKGAWTCEQS